MGPMAGQAEDPGTVYIIGISRWKFSLGYFVGQPGPQPKIGMAGTGDSNSHGMTTPPAPATGVLSTIEGFMARAAKIVYSVNIDVFLKIRIAIGLNRRAMSVDLNFKIAEIAIGVGVVTT